MGDQLDAAKKGTTIEEKPFGGFGEHRDRTDLNHRIILREDDCPEALGYAYSDFKKWKNLVIIFLVQCSMNINTSLYSNALAGMSKEFGISEQSAVTGAAVFLITYAFGCELWAPWSEEFGRKIILQASLFLVNICCIPVALAKSYNTVVIARAFGGLFSAGGGITLGICADMYTSDTQGYAVAFIVMSSVGGSIFGPIIGGFLETYMNWRWCMWFQIIIGGFTQALHLFFCDETRSVTLVDREAKRRRKDGHPNVFGPGETKEWKEAFSPKELVTLWMRPFKMFCTEPIVLVLSLLSGWSDALIFMGFQSFGFVFALWDFKPYQIGLTFVGIGMGYMIGYIAFLYFVSRNNKQRRAQPYSEYNNYEARLWGLLWTAPALPIGMLIFAWTSNKNLHWVGPIFGAGVFGIANYAIYMATIDYMVAAYGPYSSSATGGNGFARDFLAGCLTWAARPYYDAFRVRFGESLYLQMASTVLALISFILVAASFTVYWKGPALRAKSPFAQRLAR